MNKHAVVLAVAGVMLVAGIGSASASGARTDFQIVARYNSLPTAPLRISTESPPPTGQYFDVCGREICHVYNCYETDEQSVCDYIDSYPAEHFY